MMVANVPINVPWDKLNAENGVMGDSQWYLRSCFSNWVSSEISLFFNLILSKVCAHAFIVVPKKYPEFVRETRRIMDNKANEKVPADARYKPLEFELINTLDVVYKVAVDISRQVKYVFIINPENDLSAIRTISIKSEPTDTNFSSV